MGITCHNEPITKIMMGGLDASGKTTILYQLKLREVVSSVPTIGFNVQEIMVKDKRLQFWDLGGSFRMRQLYRHYMYQTHGLVYVIDLSDEQRLNQSLQQLWTYYLKYIDIKIPVLIYLNKADMQMIDVNKLSKRIKQLYPCRKIFLAPCIALQRQTLQEGLQWISQNVNVKQVNLYQAK